MTGSWPEGHLPPRVIDAKKHIVRLEFTQIFIFLSTNQQVGAAHFACFIGVGFVHELQWRRGRARRESITCPGPCASLVVRVPVVVVVGGHDRANFDAK